MTKLIFKNGHILTPLEHRFCDLWVEDGIIKFLGGCQSKGNNGANSGIGDNKTVSKLAGWQEIDATGCLITPGLIDLQVNGTASCDLWAEPSSKQIETMCRELASHGVTGFLPTLITASIDHLKSNQERLNQYGFSSGAESSKPGARMLGVHLEGPFLSRERPGVHPPEHIRPLNLEDLKNCLGANVKLVTLAPETETSQKTLDYLQANGITVSLGHSNATFEEAKAAFNKGVTMVTHLFNAMPALHHRLPGLPGAALLDKEVSCCVICDGQHLSPSAVKLVLEAKGTQKTILVTDIAHIGTSQGGLVGSSIMLDEAVRNVVNWGLAGFSQAIKMASYNPAKALNLNHIGEIASGKWADILLWDKDSLKLKAVYIGGKAHS
jgi:N-acetylglucosamine-6-phosphate deacetylase